MKTRLALTLISSLFICLFTSCEKEINIVPTPYAFEGEWKWIKTTSGWAHPIYPDSIGHTLSLIIDHTTYTMLTDDMITDQLAYEFKTDTNHFGTLIESILLESGKQYYIQTADSVNLILNDGWIDGSVWYYVRK